MSIRVAVVGAGAFGAKHLSALKRIDSVEISTVVDSDLEKAHAMAVRFGVEGYVDALYSVLADHLIDAVILCTPTPLHAAQGLACLNAGKHVLIEIPMADRWSDVEALVAAQRASGKVGMCGHTRRFNLSHQWIHRRIRDGKLALQHLDAQTFFMRRSNVNLDGEPRVWTDHLLWHHAAHTVDLFAWQTGEDIVRAHAFQGPRHPVLGIATDISIQLQSSGGALCTLALSFNNDGPQGSFFRYIGDTGTYIARYDELTDGHGASIDVSSSHLSLDGVELQDREFVGAITEKRHPVSAFEQLLPSYRVLRDLESQMLEQRPSPSPKKGAGTGSTAFL
jgi:2-hydroxy-4-carboxymuconate semialdehyde hemiacetal dehydrogenase